ncbi:MAG TPA: DNA primase [Bacteroidales bacterium]|nr:DNA primase [Bacteroidales bacterium]
MIDKTTIDRIFAAADIVDVIGEFVSLKKTGQNYRGLSPFKNEKTPSFFVSPAKGIFKCFSTGIGGSAVTFLMEHEKITYPEALHYLARKYNIEIVEKEESAQEIQQKNERESLLAVNQFACQYFMDVLHSVEGRAIGMSYFIERGFREDTIRKFQLGYAREEKNAFTRTAEDKGYKTDYLVKTGLTLQRDNYSYDRFHGRVMFPIHGLTGQILGFGGRIMKSDEKSAKYINSPESEVYHKSDILYGLYFARQAILKNDKCYLVEGYTDVISMHQAGVENVVSSSGTSLTINQIRLIKRFSHNITILYDGDEAGIKASLRGIDLLLEEGLNVRVVLLPDGEDPDSFARKNNANAFTGFILTNESDFISFKTNLLVKEAETDPIKKANLVTEIIKTISVIPESIVRSVYIRECSRLLDVDEKVLYAETARLRRSNTDQKIKHQTGRDYFQPPVQVSPVKFELLPDQYIAEKEVIRLLLLHGNKPLSLREDEKGTPPMTVTDYILHEIEQDELEFHHPVFNQILSEIVSMRVQHEVDTQNYFVRLPDEMVSKTVVDLITSAYDLSKIWKKHENYFETEDMRLKEIVPEAILALKNEKVLKLIKETEADMRYAQEQHNDERIHTLQVKYMVLNNLKMNLSRGLGDRIIITPA